MLVSNLKDYADPLIVHDLFKNSLKISQAICLHVTYLMYLQHHTIRETDKFSWNWLFNLEI